MIKIIYVLSTFLRILTEKYVTCLILPPKIAQTKEIFQNFVPVNFRFFFRTGSSAALNIHFYSLVIPIINLDGDNILNIPIDQLRSSFESILSNENLKNPKSVHHLRILLCFMCGGDKNDVEIFFSQLSSRFSVTLTNQSSFLINLFIGRLNRKVKKMKFYFSNSFISFVLDRIHSRFISFVICC
jgi:hypothetical protein